jgi:FtsH-binding integral membrane protein
MDREEIGELSTMAQASAVKTTSEARINSFIAQVYVLMTVGLAVTALTSMWTSTNARLLLRISIDPWMAFGLFIIQILIVVAISASVMRLSAGVAAILFLFYSALTGVTISSIFLIYSQEQISSVFWIAAGTFLLSGLAGLLVKRDLAGAGNVLFMLLMGWIVAWIVSWFFPASNFNWALNFIGIAIFVGLAAYDTNRLKQIGSQLDSHPARGGLVVMGALQLYLDFINLFLLLLRARSRN